MTLLGSIYIVKFIAICEKTQIAIVRRGLFFYVYKGTLKILETAVWK